MNVLILIKGEVDISTGCLKSNKNGGKEKLYVPKKYAYIQDTTTNISNLVTRSMANQVAPNNFDINE